MAGEWKGLSSLADAWRVLSYMGYIGMCGPKGYGFSAILVLTRV